MSYKPKKNHKDIVTRDTLINESNIPIRTDLIQDLGDGYLIGNPDNGEQWYFGKTNFDPPTPIIYPENAHIKTPYGDAIINPAPRKH